MKFKTTYKVKFYVKNINKETSKIVNRILSYNKLTFNQIDEYFEMEMSDYGDYLRIQDSFNKLRENLINVIKIKGNGVYYSGKYNTDKYIISIENDNTDILAYNVENIINTIDEKKLGVYIHHIKTHIELHFMNFDDIYLINIIK